jgi:hypothetical protein
MIMNKLDTAHARSLRVSLNFNTDVMTEVEINADEDERIISESDVETFNNVLQEATTRDLKPFRPR